MGQSGEKNGATDENLVAHYSSRAELIRSFESYTGQCKYPTQNIQTGRNYAVYLHHMSRQSIRWAEIAFAHTVLYACAWQASTNTNAPN